MEELARKIASNIGSSLSFNTEKIAVISYGLSALFQMLFIFAIVSILGILGNFLIEGMIIFFSVGFLRKSTGGSHSSTFTGCLIFSIFFICLMSFLSRYLCISSLLYLYVFISIFVFALSSYVLYKNAPVSSPNKPIVNSNKIARLRRNTFFTFGLYALLTSTLFIFSSNNERFIGFAISISMAVLWQSFMLTAFGDKFIKIIDQKIGFL